MFNLETAITEWRRQMVAAGIKTPVPLEELESHLRDDIEQQMRSGSSAEQAFKTAVRQIGEADGLKAEFTKAEKTKAMALRGLKSLLVITFSVSLVTLNIYLAGELKAICLIDGLLLSLVLPFTASSQTTRNTADSKRRSRTVWTGQLLVGLCGLLIVLSSHPVLGLTVAVVSCLVFTLALRRPTCAAVARS